MEILVDCENVGVDRWIPFINIGKNDRVFLFYSSGVSATVHLDALAKILNSPTSRIALVKCSAGKNSMDLCIASKCGELFNKERRPREYLIVSNDTGYDGFINTCKEQGRRISRFGTVQNSENIIAAGLPKPAESVSVASREAKLSKKQKKTIREFCKERGLKEAVTDNVVQYFATHGVRTAEADIKNILKKKSVKESKVKNFVSDMKKSLLPALS